MFTYTIQAVSPKYYKQCESCSCAWVYVVTWSLSRLSDKSKLDQSAEIWDNAKVNNVLSTMLAVLQAFSLFKHEVLGDDVAERRRAVSCPS